jgi:hypothetical protein
MKHRYIRIEHALGQYPQRDPEQRNPEHGGILIGVVAFMFLITWMTFIFSFNTIVSDSNVVELDGICQVISRTALQEFPHPTGGARSLVMEEVSKAALTYDPTKPPNMTSALGYDLKQRIDSTLALMGTSSYQLVPWNVIDKPLLHEALLSSMPENQIIYSFRPMNYRVNAREAAQGIQDRWNSGVSVLVAKRSKPIGIKVGFATDIARVYCESEAAPTDFLLINDTSETQALWTKAGDGEGLQPLCTVNGKRYEEYAQGQTPHLGAGGPKRNKDTGNIDVFSLCFRVCVAGVGPNGEVIPNNFNIPGGTRITDMNPYMLLAGPAGRQGDTFWDTAGTDSSRPAEYSTPYEGQRVVCHTCHSAPEYCHIMLSSASEGRARYCPTDPNQNQHTPVGYHPMCYDQQVQTGALGSCVTTRDCEDSVYPTASTAIVPRAKDMMFTERDVIDFITIGFREQDDVKQKIRAS